MLHIDIPTLDEFKNLARVKGETCVSLYMPTSRLGRDARVNRLVFKDLAGEALAQLKEAGADKKEIAVFEQRFDHIAGADRHSPDEDKIRQRQRAKPDPMEEFWHHQADGLAVLTTRETARTFRLPDRPKPLAEVADRLHLTPLIRAMTSPHDVFVLALAEESVRLVHAFANYPPQRVQVPGLPKNAEEATGRPSFHVRAPRHKLQNLEGEKVLLRQYLSKVEQAVRSAIAGWTSPVVLAATEPMASMYRSLNAYPRLTDEVIAGNPGMMTDAELQESAMSILDQLYLRELRAAIATYDELKPLRATTDISYAAHAATAGAVDWLLVDLDAVVPGLVSDFDGSVTYSASDDAETYSVVDEVARRALSAGARVMAAKKEELPNKAPLAAILRYQLL
jgi:hypothetical protein